MKKNFWKIAACYLLIGILWSSFAAYKGAQLGQYHPDKGGVGVVAPTVLANAFLWPVAVPLGIDHIATE